MTGRLDPRHHDRRLLVLFVLALGAPIAAVRPQSPGQATQVVNGAVVPAQRLPPATLDIFEILRSSPGCWTCGSCITRKT
jgi:hypothetical protein